MKKNGFTLAEVLITLAIIGVVATMTLPALMTNTGEQQAKTGLKKGINTLTEAAQMNQSLEGWDYASAVQANETVTAGMDTTKQNFVSLLANRTSIDYKLGNALPTKGSLSTTLKGYNAVYLKDGSAIYYDPGTAIANDTNTKKKEDNLSEGYVVYYDTNGIAGPNIVSNCKGAPLGTTSDDGSYSLQPSAATTACKDKSMKVIKDVFAVRLREAHAFPEGNAALWAFHGDVTGSTSALK